MKLCLHTITTKPWSLEDVARHYRPAGVEGVTVWRDAVPAGTHAAAGARLREAGLEIVSYCRGGFFPAKDAAGRQAAVDDNKRVIDEAAALGAPLIVLVCGAVPGQPLAESRRQIADGLAAVLPHAAACGVRLGIEPLHPMYADSRSAINTLGQANDLAQQLDSPFLGVTVDVYHLWWDPALRAEIARCGGLGKLFSYHICDWKTPTEDLLLDRGLMGEGCIPLREIGGWVGKAGFAGYAEVEIFSKKYWAMDQAAWLQLILQAWHSLHQD